MLKASHQLNSFNRISTNVPGVAILTLGVGLYTVVPPAYAMPFGVQQGSYIQSVQQQPTVSSYIYGSPIPSPIPLNSVNGFPDLGVNNSYPEYGFRRRERIGGTIQNSTLINPTVVNSNISDSVLINPVIVNEPVYPRSYNTYNRRSGFIYSSPGIQIQIRY